MANNPDSKSGFKYKIIKTRQQYNEYCELLETLVLSNNAADIEEIDLLTLLKETWDNTQRPVVHSDPI